MEEVSPGTIGYADSLFKEPTQTFQFSFKKTIPWLEPCNVDCIARLVLDLECIFMRPLLFIDCTMSYLHSPSEVFV
jgi:hypothetical protein